MSAKYFPEFEESFPDMTGKTIVITGTTSGTGLVALKTLTKKGAKVIALNRNTEKAQKAIGDDSLKVEHVVCDLQSFASVKKAAESILEMCKDEGIYCLANNAGVMMLRDYATDDGYDVQMQTNHLSHFLLTKLLLPLLEKYTETHGEARIVNHSSGARTFARAGLRAKYFEAKGGHLGGNGTLAKFRRYAQTKLSNVVFTYALQDKLQEKHGADCKVKVVVCHPGVAKTALSKNMKFSFTNIGTYLFKIFVMGWSAQPLEDGTLGLLSCIGLKEVESGDFYGPGPRGFGGKAVKFPPESYDTSKKNKDLLWEMSEKAVQEFVE